MIRRFTWLLLAFFLVPSTTTHADEKSDAADSIRRRLVDYLQKFNAHDIKGLASHWTENSVAIDVTAGTRTEGRAAIQAEFKEFFQTSKAARLSAHVDHIRMIQPTVASVEGRTTLTLSDEEAVDSGFTLILVKDGDNWQISNLEEREIPLPVTSYDALKDLEWLVGTWQDQGSNSQVETTVRWSAKRAFLLRSFRIRYEDGAEHEGTQVIGWDAANRSIRIWSFDSDGTIAEGTMAKNGADWTMRVRHTDVSGEISTSTQIITQTGSDSMTVQTLGVTSNGEPQPAGKPVTVSRVVSQNADAARPAIERQRGAK